MTRHPRLALVLVLLALAACNGPFVLLPGGALEGRVEPAPSSWGFAGAYGTVQLETRPEEPYSVNIAFTVVGDQLYVNAGDTRTQWVENMTENPDVRLRMRGVIYELRAERVTDRALIAEFARAWTAQSIFRRDPSDMDPVYIYRLVPRDPPGVTT